MKLKEINRSNDNNIEALVAWLADEENLGKERFNLIDMALDSLRWARSYLEAYLYTDYD
jgi:hypothetical protein